MKKWTAVSVAVAFVFTSFIPIGLAAKKKKGPPPKLEVTGETKHRFVGTSYRGKVWIADENGNVEWEFPAPNAQDVFMLDGKVMFNTRNGAQLVNVEDKKVVWEYKATEKCEIHSCRPLKNGNVLISVSGQSKVIEVDKDGNVAKTVQFKDVSKHAGNAHMELRDSLKTPQGTYMVAFLMEGVIRELDENGKVLRTIEGDFLKPKGVSSLQVLENGNLLVGCGYARNVLEIDKDNKVVWSLTEKDIQGLNLGYVATATRLKNGNTLISLYHGSYAFFEVTPDKKISWSIKGGPFHATTAIEYLD